MAEMASCYRHASIWHDGKCVVYSCTSTFSDVRYSHLDAETTRHVWSKQENYVAHRADIPGRPRVGARHTRYIILGSRRFARRDSHS